MDAEITTRQYTFLKALGELVAAKRNAVHYTEVAAHLEVNRYSAYDMLKVLERKQLVATDYVLDAAKEGPGRSKVVFFPTRAGIDRLRQSREVIAANGGTTEDLQALSSNEEWVHFKGSILKRLSDARQASTKELLLDLLSRLPERRRPLHYCAQMVTALLLNLARVHEHVAAISPFVALDALTAGNDEPVSALVGLSLGSALVVPDPSDSSVAQTLVAQMHSFQQHLHSLSEDSRRRLGAFMGEAIQTFEPPAPIPAAVISAREPG